MYITNEVPIRTGAVSIYPYSEWLENLFKVEPKYDEPFFMCKRAGNVLEVPRNIVPIGKEDHRVRYPVAAINCQIKPRDAEQKTCIDKSVGLLVMGQNHILQAPTGWGKTYAGISIACAIGAPTLIVVTKQDLIPAWHKAILAAGYKTTDIGHIQGAKTVWKGKQFVVAMVQSLIIADKYEADMFRYFGMVIFDEVHRMGADKFSIAAGLFPAYHRLGMSATPRKDGKEPVIEAHIGPIMVKGMVVPMKPKILVKKTNWGVPSGHYRVMEGGQWKHQYGKLPIVPGRMMPVYKAMGEDAKRNALIVEFVVSAYNAGREGIVVMADLLDDHLKPLFHLLVKEGISGDKMGYYISGLKPAELEANAHKRIILATKKMCSEGTNFEHWDTLILTTPSSDVQQMVGRILRSKEGKRQPVVLDLVDNEQVLKSFYYSRLKQYYSIGAEIVEMD